MSTHDSPIHILLADDDEDDWLFFRDVLDELPFHTYLTAVHDGDELMYYLHQVERRPHALFLDLNMPRKNGHECLTEIKSTSRLRTLPVIIYSTSYSKEVADALFNQGADYYICKPPDFIDLRNAIHYVLNLVVRERNRRPTREHFLINHPKPSRR